MIIIDTKTHCISVFLYTDLLKEDTRSNAAAIGGGAGAGVAILVILLVIIIVGVIVLRRR